MSPQNHPALTYVSSKQQSLTFWGISGMRDSVVICDGCAIKSACVAPVALGERILERVREANRQGSESCRPRRAMAPTLTRVGCECEHPQSEEVLSPLGVCWPHTQKKEKTKKGKKERRRDLSCNHSCQTRISKSRTALWIRVVPRESTTTTK